MIPLRGDWTWVMKTQIASSSRNSVHTNCSKLARAALVLNVWSLGLLPLAVTAQPACVSPPAGLVGWWRGEGNGNDSAGTNNAYSLAKRSLHQRNRWAGLRFRPVESSLWNL